MLNLLFQIVKSIFISFTDNGGGFLNSDHYPTDNLKASAEQNSQVGEKIVYSKIIHTPHKLKNLIFNH
jgi:hypothetical protein